MNYYLMTRHEVVTNQIVIRYVPDNQRLVVFLPQEDRIVSFDVPWANDAFFDTIGRIGAALTWNARVPIQTVVAYENDSGIVLKVNDKMWTLKKPTAADPVDDPSTPELDRIDMAEHEDPEVFKPTGEKYEGAFVADELGPTNYPKGDTDPT